LLGSSLPRLIVAAGGALVLAGCGSGHDTPSHASSPSGPAKASPSAPASASGPASLADAAADGTDVKACADGRCEVRVTAPARIPVPRRMKIASVRVQSVSAKAVTIVGHEIGNSSNSSVIGNVSAESNNGVFRLVMGADSEVRQNGLHLTVVALDDEFAVLRIGPS
jgi:hypothetical protein